MNPSREDLQNYNPATPELTGRDQFPEKTRSGRKRLIEEIDLDRKNDSYIRSQQITTSPIYPPLNLSNPSAIASTDNAPEGLSPVQSTQQSSQHSGSQRKTLVSVAVGVVLVLVVAVARFVLFSDSGSDHSDPQTTAANTQNSSDYLAEMPDNVGSSESGDTKFGDIPAELQKLTKPNLCYPTPLLTGTTGPARKAEGLMCTVTDFDKSYLSFGYAKSSEAAKGLASDMDSAETLPEEMHDSGLLSKDDHKVVVHDLGTSHYVYDIRKEGVVWYLVDDLEKFKKGIVDEGLLKKK